MVTSAQKKTLHSKLAIKLSKLTIPESSTSPSQDNDFDFSDLFGPNSASSSSPSSETLAAESPQVIHHRSHSFVGPSPRFNPSFKSPFDPHLGTGSVEGSSEEDEIQEIRADTVVEKESKIGPGDFVILRVVGKGAFGKVFQVRKRERNGGGVGGDGDGIFAMKVMRKETIIKNKHVDYMKAERDILTKVVHPFVVQLRYSFQTKSKLYLILDFINGGHLFYHLYRQGIFSEEQAKVYAAEIVSAVSHLHMFGIVHRDLKPENILMDSEGHSLLKAFHKGPPIVRTQISLAVAALAVHVPAKDWGDGGIVNWVGDEINAHPECIPSFLELLRVLPEEAYNYKIAARPDRRRQFDKELAFTVEVALNILTACLNINELKEQVLEAFASWLRLRHLIPASTLASHPLVLTALSSLNSDILSEASVNVISELIQYSASRKSGGVNAQIPLIQLIVPQVMSLKPQIGDSSKDEEDVKAIARLFADLGDSYLELIANGSDESMLIVQALLEVASHPEYDIASMTFNFWHNLQIYLIEKEAYVSFANEALMDAERNRRLLIFRSSYETLVSLVSFKVQYPEDHANLSKEDLKDFKQTRYDVADVLIDAALVLGGEVILKLLYMKLIEVVGSSGNDNQGIWRPAEAALYCIRAISDYVSVSEGEIMPQVMSLLPKLPHQPQLQTTVCYTIGAYSKWLDTAPSGLSFLPALVDILVRGMSTSEDSAAAAALAFRHICSDCGKKLCGSLDGLLHIYQRAMVGEGTFKVSPEDSLHLVEALSVVITELPSDHAKKGLEVLCLPAVTPLQEMINQGPLVLGQALARDLTVHIDRLANIFRYVNNPEAVADAIQRLWPIFKAIFDIRAWDTRTMESLCRACKNAVRTSKRFMGLTIGAMLEEIQALYKQHHQPCFLYLSSEVIKIFGSDPSCADYLKVLIESLFGQTICMLSIIQDFTSRPDIADDCFLLGSRCIRYCPQLFFTSAVFPSLVNCSMIGMTVQHREASNSILTFLSDIFDLAKSSPGENYVSIRDGVIVPRGATITRILVASLTGALPSSRLESVVYALLALTRAYGPRALEWAKESVSLIPPTAVTDVERSRFLQALSDVVSGRDINSVMVPIEELAEVCRRNRTVQEIVQGALRPLELNLITVS